MLPNRRFLTLAFVAVYSLAAIPALMDGNTTAAKLVATTVLGLTLVALSVIDVATFRLPDWLTIPLALIGLPAGWVIGLEPGTTVRAVAGFVGYGILWAVGWLYQRVRARAGLGMGDAKLFASAGTWTALEGLAPTLLLACVSALAFIGIQTLRGRPIDLQHKIAFGPFIAGGIWLVWLYGPIV